ncbi:MAG TPA: PDZ domain-containing protein [Verrucomicrobia bacterium]|nr:PDZ domain-containing protein [Verrucomicrobiales bacterium]HIL54605.1 PDZ domain-containing protein [Verrucomicrobiota bacterium]
MHYHSHKKNILIFFVAHTAYMISGSGQEVVADPAPERITKTVQIIKKSLPSVASIQTFKESGTPGIYNVQAGSASVIHESGYLLTNDHVISGIIQGNAILYGRPPLPFKTIARMSSEDLAIIKIDAESPLQPLPIGRSNDLMLGEAILTIGNPGGLNHSVSTGIISGINRSTSTGSAFLPWMIQTSAAVSGGNSGGPLINALGEHIGTITSKQLGSENINFAIAIDRVREVFPRMLSPELRYGFWIGVEIDMYGPTAKILSVADRSPAQKTGLVAGDIITKIDESLIKNGFEYLFTLIDRSPKEALEIEYIHEKEKRKLRLILSELELLAPVPEEGMKPGIHFEAFSGKWNKLPDFNSLEKVKEGIVKIPTEQAFVSEGGEDYGLRFTGFIKIKDEGLYTFKLSSDDGSQLSIGDQLLVDNDGLHGVISAIGLIRLRAGMHPISITFFENSGDQKLDVSYEGPNISSQQIPQEVYYTK